MSAPLPAGIDVARGTQGAMFPHKFLEHIVICALRGGIQCRINNSSKSSNCYGPRAFGGPEVFCNKSDLLHYT